MCILDQVDLSLPYVLLVDLKASLKALLRLKRLLLSLLEQLHAFFLLRYIEILVDISKVRNGSIGNPDFVGAFEFPL